MISRSFKKPRGKGLFRVLENRDFLLLWSGEIISQFGDRLAQIALVGIYLAHTKGMSVDRSVPLMSGLFFFSTLPVLIFSPVAGFFVDRWSRRNTLMVADFVRAGLVLLIPLFQLEVKSIYYIYVVIFAVFATTCFFNPAKLAFIPALVSQERLLAANSLSNITRIIAMIGGVIAGGFVVARIGVRGSFVLDALSFAFSGLLVANIKVKGKPGSENIKASLVGKVGKQIQEGFKFIWRRKQIFFISLTLFVLMGAAGIGYVIVTVLVTKGLGLGTEGLSFAAASLGTGMIAGSLIYGEFGGKLNRYFVVMVGSFLAGLCSLLLAEAQEIRLILLGVFLVGFVSSLIMIAFHTFCQESTPDEVRGRVFAALEILINASFLLFVWIAGVLGSSHSFSLIFSLLGLVLILYSGFMILITGFAKKFA